MYVDLQQQLTTLQAAFEPNAIALAEAQRIARSIHKKYTNIFESMFGNYFDLNCCFFISSEAEALAASKSKLIARLREQLVK